MGACLCPSEGKENVQGSDGSLQASCTPLFFHPYIKGSQVIMDNSCCIVSRIATFHDGIVFSNRPIELYEKVTVKILQEDQKWQGGLRVGFTWKDPCLQSRELPPFVCPDLVKQGKTSACVLPDEYIAEDTIVSFWVDSQGCVFCSINLEAEGFFLFNGVSVESPVWAVVDVYGRTKAVQLLDSTCLEFQEGAEESTAEDCMVCFASKANTMMLPCCHDGFCSRCALKILNTSGRCPLCRQAVKKILLISILAERDDPQSGLEKSNRIHSLW
ncbi:E3 ubiquitin-protein ligase NEURL3 isoform X1 [Python bivittatus]|uniref:E3 ubiquitin-protein ligase NEURL3 isoform X1 n=1 Tax=Python bivittatus TaxID=176946 RepID=A0A9F2WAL8_PYTBI|nr:E3 ubiquitin-protein ligase NEURL3 isoform X1 [Python bivittatus]